MIYYYVYKGKKYGSVNEYKIRCMGKRDVGGQCKFGVMPAYEFLPDKNNIELGSEWND